MNAPDFWVVFFQALADAMVNMGKSDFSSLQSNNPIEKKSLDISGSICAETYCRLLCDRCGIGLMK
jgi:hypothetical protein